MTKDRDDRAAALNEAATRAAHYLQSLPARPVGPSPDGVAAMTAELGGQLPETGMDAAEVVGLLDTWGSGATVASAGPRYFGFVTGGALPAALAANWLASAWDQNAFSHMSSPLGAVLERTAIGWVRDALGLPSECEGAFVTGATMANFTALAAARHALLERAGWNVEGDGLFGAPEIRVIVGAEAHSTLFKALGLLGLGRNRVERVPVDEQGAMRADAVPRLDEHSIVCLQAGNVNSGAFDPAVAICNAARDAGAWVHVDGAFGLWAAAAPARAHLVEGYDGADSWATDAHKWLNVPYDCGVALVRDCGTLRGVMSISAAYLPGAEQRNPYGFTPESSRRMRAVDVWAALKSLGRAGLADLVERNCRHAQQFAAGFRAAGFEVLNEVNLNQVLVSFGSDDVTERVIGGVQAEGTCWCGGTRWHDKAAMRVSVSSWATSDDDVQQSLDAIVRVANGVRAAD